jgi:hypothetical protein
MGLNYTATRSIVLALIIDGSGNFANLMGRGGLIDARGITGHADAYCGDPFRMTRVPLPDAGGIDLRSVGGPAKG